MQYHKFSAHLALTAIFPEDCERVTVKSRLAAITFLGLRLGSEPRSAVSILYSLDMLS